MRERIYAVEFVRIVNPAELNLLAPTTEDALTLITCYPFGSGRSPQRFIVPAMPAARKSCSQWFFADFLENMTAVPADLLHTEK